MSPGFIFTGAMNQSGDGNEATKSSMERTVRCPVEGCDAEPLARGVYLHIQRSSGDGHGPQGDVPPGVDLDNLETVGEKEVEMDYPDKRDTEQTARVCPYCNQTFTGIHGVMIHLGQTAGRKNHPENPKEIHEPEDFPIVALDDNENIVEVIEGDITLPSSTQADSAVERYIDFLEREGKTDEAERAKEILL